jgi:Na+-driven multidrug efflux pump
MALIALVLTWLMLPRLGIAAAGWGWLIAQSLGCVYVAVDVLRGRAGTVRPAQ